jgi:hypothetical protein
MTALVMRDAGRSPRKGAAVPFVCVGVVIAWIAALLIAASVNPGYGHQWYFLKGALPFSLLTVVVVGSAAWLLRFRLPVSIAAGVVVLCGLTGIVFGVSYLMQPDRSVDKARNLTYLNKIARYPGARLVRTHLEGIEPDTGDMFDEGHSFLSPPDGYTLEQEFALPAGASANQALNYYTTALQRNGWEVERDNENCWNPQLPNAYIQRDCGTLYAYADDTSFSNARNGVSVSINIYKYRGQLRVFLS